MNAEWMSGYRTNFCIPVRIFSRKFIESTHAREEITFRSHFAADAETRLFGQASVALIAQRQPPATSGLVHHQHRTGFDIYHTFGDSKLLSDKVGGSRVGLVHQLQFFTHFIVTGFHHFAIGFRAGEQA